MDTNLLIAVVGCGIAVLTYFVGRQSAAHNTGQEWGELKSDIKHIKGDVQEIKSEFSTQTTEIKKELAEQNKDLKQSIRRLHKRMDDHLRNEHHICIPDNDKEEL